MVETKTYLAIGGSAIGLAIISLIIFLNYPVTDFSHFCQDKPQNLAECIGGLSKGNQTRCYLNENKTSWSNCASGWLKVTNYVNITTTINETYVISKTGYFDDGLLQGTFEPYHIICEGRTCRYTITYTDLVNPKVCADFSKMDFTTSTQDKLSPKNIIPITKNCSVSNKLVIEGSFLVDFGTSGEFTVCQPINGINYCWDPFWTSSNTTFLGQFNDTELSNQGYLTLAKGYHANESGVLFLARFDGTNTTEEGENAQSMAGTVKFMNNGKFGQSVNMSSGYLTYNATNNIAWENGTIEMWVKSHNTASGAGSLFDTYNGTAGNRIAAFKANGGSGVDFYCYNSTGSSSLGQATNVFTNNTWAHLAFVYNATSTSLFVNGVYKAIAVCPGTRSNAITSTIFIFGSTSSSTWIGEFDDVRLYNRTRTATEILQDYNTYITQGTYYSEVYNATEAVSWKNLTWKDSGIYADPYTVLMLHMNGANMSTTFTDSSNGGVNSPHTMTAAGGAQIDTTQSKFGDASGEFRTNRYVNTPDSDDWDFGTGNWTLDVWILPSTTQVAYSGIIGTVSATPTGYMLWMNSNRQVGIYSTAGGSWASDLLLTTPVTANVWTHIAFVRNGNNLSGYINGAFNGSKIVTGYNYNSGNNGLIMGGVYPTANPTANPYNGSIDEVRISKGIARWTANFTPPQAEFMSDLYIINTSVRSCNLIACAEVWNQTKNSTPFVFNPLVANSTYFQYKIEYQTANYNFSPEIINVSVGYDELVTNEYPVALLINISPTTAGIDTALTCNYKGTDRENATYELTYNWSVNDVNNLSYVMNGYANNTLNYTTLTTLFNNGDKVYCNITANDGTNKIVNQSNIITIADTTPAIMTYLNQTNNISFIAKTETQRWNITDYEGSTVSATFMIMNRSNVLEEIAGSVESGGASSVVYNYSVTFTAAGIYECKVNATDSNGNSNSTEWFTCFNVSNPVSPTLTNLTIIEEGIDYVIVNCTATNGTYPISNYSFFIPSFKQTSTICSYSYSGLIPSTSYNITLNISDTFGFSFNFTNIQQVRTKDTSYRNGTMQYSLDARKTMGIYNLWKMSLVLPNGTICFININTTTGGLTCQ